MKKERVECPHCRHQHISLGDCRCPKCGHLDDDQIPIPPINLKALTAQDFSPLSPN